MPALCPCALEAARDSRDTDTLLGPLPCLAAGDREQPWWWSGRYYQFYAALGKLCRPATVLEVGVRLGYSLVAMLRGYPGISRIYGLDNETGVAGSQTWTIQNLAAAGYTGKMDFPTYDTDKLPWPCWQERFALAHVDGNHSFQGTTQSVMAAWGMLLPGGTLVVDDTEAPIVRAAVETARPCLAGRGYDFYMPTFTGWWVAGKAEG